MKKIVKVLFVLLLLFTGAVQSSVEATTYRLKRVSSITPGEKYVFEQAGYVMDKTRSSNSLMTTNSFKTAGLTGEETYVWEVVSGYKLRNVKADKYLYYTNSSTSVNLGTDNTDFYKWTFTLQVDGSFIISNNKASDRLLGYMSPTNFKYKLYTLNERGRNPYAIVAYQLVAETEGKTSPALSHSSTFVKCIKGDAVSLPTLSKAAGHDGTVSYSSTNEQVATVDAVGNVTIVGVGRTLITASSDATENYDAGEATYMIQVMDGDGTEAKPHTVSDFYSGYLGSGTKYVKGYIVGYLNGSSITTTATEDNRFLLADTKEETSVSNTVLVSLNSDIQSSFGLKSNPDLLKCSVLTCGTVELLTNVISVTSVSAVTVLTDPVTISSAQYATFHSPRRLDFSGTGLQAYTVEPSATEVVLQPITDGIVPSGKGVVLYGAAGSYDAQVTASAATVSETGLTISDGTTAVGSDIYVLAKKGENVGFGRWTSASSLSKGKVYLKYDKPGTAPEFFTLTFGNDATGIRDNNRETITNNCYYDLQGRQIVNGQLKKGLYIVNGKKVLIK